MMKLKHVAVIGAGVSGSLFASLINESSTVTLFEKARGAGGRLSSHRHGAYCFDKGAQDFSIEHNQVLSIAESARDAHVLALWKPSFMRVENNIQSWIDTSKAKIYSGLGSMNGLVKWFLRKSNVHYGHKVSRMERHGKQWVLIMEDKQKFGPFDSVVMTQPVHQVIELVPDFKGELGDIIYSCCLMVYLGLNNINLKEKAPDVIFSEDTDTLTQWMIQTHLKPGFSQNPSLTIQSKNINYIQHDGERVDLARAMIHEVEILLGTSLNIDYQHHHMWRYAKTLKKSRLDCLWDPDLGLGVIGDGFVPRVNQGVEAAMLSAIALANRFN